MEIKAVLEGRGFRPNFLGKNRKKAAKKLGLFHQKSGDQRQAYQWKTAHKIVDKNIDAIAL